jgi:hypothetical protein
MSATIINRPRRVSTKSVDNAMPDMPFQEGAHDALDPDLRHRLISEAAYSLYAQRGFLDGYDHDDWLQAETQVDNAILNPANGMVSQEEAA